MSEEDGGCQSLARKQGLCQFHYREKQEYNQQIGSEKLLHEYASTSTLESTWDMMLPILNEYLSKSVIEEIYVKFMYGR